MTNKTNLLSFLGSPILGVTAAYTERGTTSVLICGVTIEPDERLQLWFPKGHPFRIGQKITLHLDNRTGVDEYDAGLHVYRTSYKGLCAHIEDTRVWLEPRHFELSYGNRVIHAFNTPDYKHPPDTRPAIPFRDTPLTEVPIPDMSEAENKIGILVTEAMDQPHTTVLAFLSTPEDDIFFISFTDTLKSQILARNHYCHFAIDARGVFTYTQAIEWNYSIIEADVYAVPPGHPLFEPVRELFVFKNPWEVGFFSAPNVEMFHLKPRSVILPV